MILKSGIDEGFAGCRGEYIETLDAFAVFEDGVDQVFGDDAEFFFAVAAVFHEGVGDFGMDGDGEVGGERPGCRGPDEEEDIHVVPRAECELHGGGIGGGKFDVDAGVFNILVFQLGVGKGGLILDRPGDGFEFFIDEAGCNEFGEDFERAGLVVGGHGGVGFVPFG